MAVKYYICGAKGGAGATTVAAFVAAASAKRGERTLYVDGDGLCAAGVCLLDCAHLQVFTASDAENGLCRAKQALIQHQYYKNLYVMPTTGGCSRSGLENAVREVEGLFDCVICDCAAKNACDGAVIVTEPYPPSVKAADVKICALKDEGINVCGVIVNKVNGGLLKAGELLPPEEIAAALRVKFIAAIPEDLTLTVGKIRADTEKFFDCAALSLVGKEVKTRSIAQRYMGAGGYFKRKMREII